MSKMGQYALALGAEQRATGRYDEEFERRFHSKYTKGLLPHQQEKKSHINSNESKSHEQHGQPQ